MTHYFIAKLVTYIGQAVSFSAIDMVHKNLGFLGLRVSDLAYYIDYSR